MLIIDIRNHKNHNRICLLISFPKYGFCLLRFRLNVKQACIAASTANVNIKASSAGRRVAHLTSDVESTFKHMILWCLLFYSLLWIAGWFTLGWNNTNNEWIIELNDTLLSKATYMINASIIRGSLESNGMEMCNGWSFVLLRLFWRAKDGRES